ncbi:uncharacterized protein LOC124927897 isoform X1 [Impatiens glandulifera]|uniref:uncharacterized protein LOC124927897 isoform X1 n=2 Tax=Impatiens glandulifera TaxID=253017 RepID=UPI001FB0990E|nr:uncharacterized protein LOC124927897 isoform X1 [Impatiens glandulifera]
MKTFAGTPGTTTSLIIRLSQLLLGIALSVVYSIAMNPVQFEMFSFMVFPIILQVVWGVITTVADGWAVWRKAPFHNRRNVTLGLIIDWGTLLLSLAAAAISSDMLDLYIHDRGNKKEDVRMFQTYIVLTFLAWIPTAISSLILLWILPALTISHPVVHPVVGPILADDVGPAPRMTDIQGMPGTKGGLVLRLIQLVLAGISLCVIVTTRNFPMDITSFRYFMVSVVIECTWTLCMAMVDIYALSVGHRLLNHVMMTLFTIGDGVTSILLFAASSGCAGVIYFIQHELDRSSENRCTPFAYAVGLALTSWFFLFLSFFDSTTRKDHGRRMHAKLKRMEQVRRCQSRLSPSTILSPSPK